MEGFIIIAAVGVAAAFIVRDFYRKYRAVRSGGCEGGCSSCPGGAMCAGLSQAQSKVNHRHSFSKKF